MYFKRLLLQIAAETFILNGLHKTAFGIFEIMQKKKKTFYKIFVPLT